MKIYGPRLKKEGNLLEVNRHQQKKLSRRPYIFSDAGPCSFSQDCIFYELPHTVWAIPSLCSGAQSPNPYQKVVQNYHVNKFRIELLLNHFLIGQEIIRYNNEIIEIISFFKKRTYSEYDAEELEE